MIVRQKSNLRAFVHPPYIVKLENGKYVRYSDVEVIDSNLDFKMFSLSVNLQNGENLKEHKLEPISMLQEVESLAQRCDDLSTQIQNWKKSVELEERLSKLNESEVKPDVNYSAS